MKKLPIGIQSIDKILGDKTYAYIDKTSFIKQLIDEGSPHYFIARPRRFGKSLFLSTLEALFRGNKKLFKGLAIDKSGYVWKKYPVIRFDFSRVINRTPKEFEEGLKRAIAKEGVDQGLTIDTPTIQEGLGDLIEKLAETHNAGVVLLVDEYDKPIIDRLDDVTIAQGNREILKDFFTTLKSHDASLKLSFITGVSKFSQVSIFSGLNNLNDITMEPKYAGIMGYTEEEIKDSFQSHIHAIAQEWKASEESIIDELKRWYNGYRFSRGDICVYNPFSTLNFMSKQETAGYWYATGTPSFLIEQLKKGHQSMFSLDGATARKDELMDISSLEDIDLKALMYQTGYFTVQDYNPISKRYHLGLPNEEVRTAFMNSLVKHFTSTVDVRSSEKYVIALEKHQIEILFEHIKVGLSSFAYSVFAGAKERTYQAILLSMLYGMGFDPLSERLTNTGRIDVVLEMPKTTYIMELKLDGSAQAALKQIHEKEYFKPYTHAGKQIVNIGANFSSQLRNISDWTGELLSEEGSLLQTLHPKNSHSGVGSVSGSIGTSL
ncbi:MAG: AAA family ATPase [Chlamydiia bacterium]|nr:AAA family ATPase [Chlamydiia bacterium]